MRWRASSEWIEATTPSAATGNVGGARPPL
jgi:hypothetical protein